MRFAHIAALWSLATLAGCGDGGRQPAAKPAEVRDFAEDSATAAPRSMPKNAAPAGEKAAREVMPAESPVADGDFEAAPRKVSEELPTPPREQKKPGPQVGLLTAGSLNDHRNFDDYRDYLTESLQHAGRRFADFSIGRRVEIHVTDSQGNQVGGATVDLRDAESEELLLTTRTRADGRAFLATGLDAKGHGDDGFLITVTPVNGESVSQTVSLDQTPWEINLPGADAELPGRLDLSLVIDTTGSMSDELKYIAAEIDGIAARVARKFPNVDQRYSLILYRDEGDKYVTRVFDFVKSVRDFRQTLSKQAAAGGGDTPEAMHVALEKSTELSWRDGNTARVMFLVADAPPHDHHIDRTFKAVRKLRERGVAMYPLAGSGVRDTAEFIMRAAAFMTKGRYLFLTDHSGIGNAHATPHAPKFDVEPLDQLMTRMIATELAGREVLAQEIIATEQSDGSAPPPPPEQNQVGSLLEQKHTEQYHTSHDMDVRHNTSLWESSAFRWTAAVVAIAGILFVDMRLRA